MAVPPKATSEEDKVRSRGLREWFRKCMLVAWVKDYGSGLSSPPGWKVAAQTIGAFILVVGFLLGLATYRSTQIGEALVRARSAYERLATDLVQDSTLGRIAALKRLPDLATERHPVHLNGDLGDMLELMVGDETPLYHAQLLGLLRLRFESFHEDPPASLAERRAALEALIRLGPEGWYLARPAGRNVEVTRGLRWIWNEPEPPDRLLESPTEILTGVNLSGLDFSHFDLQHADLTGTVLRGAALDFARLNPATLDHAVLVRASLTGIRLTGSSLRGAQLQRADLENANLAGAKLERANLEGARLHDADLTHANLLGANLRDAKLVHADMRFANLQSAVLDGADLSEANLHRVELLQADLSGAFLFGSSLVLADLRFADLEGARLDSCDLYRADLSGADLRNAVISNAEGLEYARDWRGANITGLRGVSETQVQTLLGLGAVAE